MGTSNLNRKKPPGEGGIADGRACRGGKRPVRASELAQMGVCERLVVFEHRFGRRTTGRQRRAVRRGVAAHEMFHREGVRASAEAAASTGKGHCHIATPVFGQGRETETLKQFRDRVLRPRAAGRWLIGACHRTAPAVHVILARCPCLRPVVRAILKPVVWLIRRALDRNGGGHAGK